MVAAFGNKGLWAQPLLDQYVKQNKKTLISNGQLISVTQYMQWFNQLPSALRKEVINKWGSAPGKIMVSGSKIVIPGMMFGNLFNSTAKQRMGRC